MLIHWPWYMWYFGIGILYCLGHVIFGKGISLVLAFENVRKKWLAKDVGQGHTQIEKYGDREVIQPLDTWGRLRTDSLHDLEKLSQYLEKRNGLSFVFEVVMMLICALAWPFALYEDMQKGICYFRSKRQT